MTETYIQPRISPIKPPYDPDTEAQLAKWMPPGSPVEPLALFRTLLVHPELAARMRPLGSAILGHGLLDARTRELMILRTCALCGAEYEWGVHAVAFGSGVGLTEEEIAATAGADGDWPGEDRLVIRLADELHDGDSVSQELWDELARVWTSDQLLELLVTAGWYRTLSYVINAAQIELEPWAARFPAA
ncbi:MAG: carboxymuconolactone decarboxylase family protein [Solirubrobacteraceae bacterium]